MFDAGDEGLIDLERIDRERLNVPQRRISRAEIVNAKIHADGFEAREHSCRARFALQNRRFGNFERELSRIEAMLFEQRREKLRKIRLQHFLYREIDVQRNLAVRRKALPALE